jgi:Mg2+/citrate symporter
MLNDAATAYAILIPFTIAGLVWLLILFDWLGRRRDRQKREGRT